jgi:hypothetical protein
MYAAYATHVDEIFRNLEKARLEKAEHANDAPGDAKYQRRAEYLRRLHLLKPSTPIGQWDSALVALNYEFADVVAKANSIDEIRENVLVE